MAALLNQDGREVLSKVTTMSKLLDMEQPKKTVIDWLNEVSYEVDPTYKPSLFALEFINFIKLVNGAAGEEHPSPVLHYKMLDTLVSGDRRIANMVHRGAAKTTVMAEYLFLYLGVFGKLPEFGRIELALYVSDSIDNGVKNMRKNLEFRYENSAFLQRMIPMAKFTDIRWEFRNLEGDVTVIKGYGAKTGVRGTKEMGKRPKLAVLDDLVSDEDARSPTIISAIEDTVYKAVEYALHPSLNMMVWSGTPFNAGDPLYKAVEDGAWTVNVYPVCEMFPCAPEDFRGSWPERFDYNYVKTQYDKALLSGKIAMFNQELMLKIMSDEDRLIADGDIRMYSRQALLQHKGNYNFYITTDFATSDKQASDNSVISVWAYNNNGDWFLVDGICERQDMGKNVDMLFKLVSQYQPMEVGVEVSGQQGGFIPWIMEQMVTRNIFFNMASKNNSSQPGIRPATDKMQRFNVVVPWFKAGKMYFPREMGTSKLYVEMMEELKLASLAGFKSKHDDALDTISMLALLNVFKPGTPSAVHYDDQKQVWFEPDVDSGHLGISSYVV